MSFGSVLGKNYGMDGEIRDRISGFSETYSNVLCYMDIPYIRKRKRKVELDHSSNMLNWHKNFK